MWPISPTGGGVCCGYEDASPVSDRYVAPAVFTGVIHGVTVLAGDDSAPNAGLDVLIAISED